MSTKQLLTGDLRAREGREKFCVQLLTFIPGETLDSVLYTPRLAYEAGRYLGSMDAALQVCMHKFESSNLELIRITKDADLAIYINYINSRFLWWFLKLEFI